MPKPRQVFQACETFERCTAAFATRCRSVVAVWTRIALFHWHSGLGSLVQSSQRGVVVGKRCVAVSGCMAVVARGGTTVAADPLDQDREGDQHDGRFTESPGDRAAGGLVGERIDV